MPQTQRYLEQHTENKRLAGTLLGRLADLLEADGYDQKQVRAVAENLEANRFKVIFTGEFSTGKSTLINALLGRAILPAKVKPTTATLCEVRDGEPGVTVVYHDQRRRQLELDQLRTFATALDEVGAEEARLIARMEISYPCPFTREGVVIVDTPGVEDLDQQREDVTYAMIPQADAAVLILDAMRPFKRSEKQFLEERLLANQLGKIFFVLNYKDVLVDEDEDPEEVLAYVRQKLSTVPGLKGEPKLFMVSAKWALHAKVTGEANPYLADIRALEQELERFLVSERGDLLVRNSLVKALAPLNELTGHLRFKADALDSPLHEVQAQERHFQTVLSTVLQQRGRLVAEIRSGFSQAAETAEPSLQAAYRKALSVLESAEFPDDSGDELNQLVSSKFKDELRKEIQASVMPTVLEKVSAIVTRAEERLKQILGLLDSFKGGVHDPLRVTLGDDVDFSKAKGGFSVSDQQWLMGTGAWFGVPFLVSMFASGGLALIPWAVGMAASYWGILSWGKNRQRDQSIRNIRQMEKEVLTGIGGEMSQQVAQLCDQFVRSLEDQVDTSVANTKQTLAEILSQKEDLQGRINEERARLTGKLRDVEALREEMQQLTASVQH